MHIESIQFTHREKTLETKKKKKERKAKSGNKMVNRLILIWQNAFKWKITKTREAKKKQSWILTIYAKQNTTRSLQTEIFTMNANKTGPNGGVANNSRKKNYIQFKFNDFNFSCAPIFLICKR